uniref:Uncharacterized protein LOC111099689 isoform X1 n=1 Tax=Crassostrea virginica TaxID=6565 RepID=A0A8B8AA90_CRAVI|nr:uncharacterized protein LOC111099689 isoform X1 [Crassostrea virginica]XP_022286794.1 uncharacterized protein LOC111099689 isoform X1 [Crassostrea virginica]
MGEVNVCPKNQTEVDEAGKRLGCGQDKYGHSQYMCLPNEEKTSLVEFCYNGVMGIVYKGCCLEASARKVIRRECSSFAFGCPEEHVYKYELFKYPACQYINVKHRCYKLDPSCPPEKQWNSTDRTNNSTINYIVCDYNQNNNIEILIILGFIVITNLLFIFYCLMKKNNKQKTGEIISLLSRNQGIELFWVLLWKGIGQTLKDYIDIDVDNRINISERSEFFIGVIEQIKANLDELKRKFYGNGMQPTSSSTYTANRLLNHETLQSYDKVENHPVEENKSLLGEITNEDEKALVLWLSLTGEKIARLN